MSESLFVYIFPYLDNINTGIDLVELGWVEKRSRSWLPNRRGYANYMDYERKTIYEGQECQVIFRRYDINSAFFVIQFGDANHYQDEMDLFLLTEVPKLFTQCGLEGMSLARGYLLKFFDNSKDLIDEKNNVNFNCLSSDNSNDNESYCFDDKLYTFKLNFNPELSETIKDNIITLLSLYEAAFHFEVLPSDEMSSKETSPEKKLLKKDYGAIIKAFWGYKFLLLKCPGSQAFPSIFKDKMQLIDNLMDRQHMDLAEQQKKLAEDQKNILEEIHHVEGGILYLTKGILYLTIFVFFDIAQSNLFELIGLIRSDEIIDLEYKVASLIMAVFISRLIWNKMNLVNSDNSKKEEKWYPGYNDRMYDAIKKSQQDLGDDSNTLVAISVLVAVLVIVIFYFSR